MKGNKILILYFSLTGRTKKVAEIIAEELKNSDIHIEPLIYIKKLKDLMLEQEKIMNGDLSSVKYNESIKDLDPYDLVFFGTPTHGGRPAAIFNGFLQHVENLDEKKFIVFNTCRFVVGKTLEIMQTEIEKKGGKVVNKQVFKGLFSIKTSKVKKFVEELNQELIKPS
jgi:flavodoxin